MSLVQNRADTSYERRIILDLEEEIDVCRFCEEKRSHLELVRLESGADTAAERGTVSRQCRARWRSPLRLA